jgi:citrate synthase
MRSCSAEIRRLCRGYPIEQLAIHSSFLETAYLLIYGALPTKTQYSIFEGEVMHHSVAHVDAEELFRSFRFVICYDGIPFSLRTHAIRYDAHPMAILTSSFAALGSYYSEVRRLGSRTSSLNVICIGRRTLHYKVRVVLFIFHCMFLPSVYQDRTCTPKMIQTPLLIWTNRYFGELP